MDSSFISVDELAKEIYLDVADALVFILTEQIRDLPLKHVFQSTSQYLVEENKTKEFNKLFY